MGGAGHTSEVAAAVGVVLVAVWLVVSLQRRQRAVQRAAGGARARDGLVEFADQSLALESAREVLAFAGDAARVIFGCERVVSFEPGTETGEWDVFTPTGEALPGVPTHLRGLFGWFRHNHAIAAETDLAHARFGAMRGPLQQVMSRYGIDVVLPLVRRDEVLAVLGLSLGRKPTSLDRELMRMFRLEATAACANVRLHREAAHLVSLAEEIDLASAVQLALVPSVMDGEEGGVTWAGHFEAASDAGSDFWSAYELGGGRVMILIGDAIGAGLAGSMVSAVVKSCADAVMDDAPEDTGPGQLLTILNRSLYHAQSSSGQTSCFAALFDPVKGEVRYSNAAHPIPYVLHFPEGEADAAGELGVLRGAGPLLGDQPDARFPVATHRLAPGSTVVLFTDGVLADRGERPGTGDRRLQRLLRRQPPAPAAAIRDTLAEAATRRRGERPLDDDEAVVVVRVEGERPA